MFQLTDNSNREIPHSAFRIPRSQRIRSGISIIEVMTAVVVAMIGVFGTLVLIPFAVKQAQSGLDLDDARNLARNSVATFDAMGFDNQRFWVAGISYRTADTPPLLSQTFNATLDRAVMIDPLWVEANRFGVAPSLDLNVGPEVAPPGTYNVENNYGFFGDGVLAADRADVAMLTNRLIGNGGGGPGAYPFHGQVHPVLPNELRIQRVGLTDGTTINPMSRPLAQRLFQSTDALSFSKFDAEEVGANGEPLGGQPFQIFDRDAASGAILRRQSDGGRLSQAMFIIPGDGQAGGLYRRVTLVFADRSLSLYSNPGGARDFENADPRSIMASALVTTRTGGTLNGVQTAGREIVLCKVDWSGGAPAPNTIYLDVVGTPEAPGVRRDDWVMMINVLPANYPVGGVGLTNRQQIQFFRVSNIDEGQGVAGTSVPLTDLPSLTLDGPDFDFGPDGTTVYPDNTIPSSVTQTYIIHLRDVVNVYEDAISL